MNPAPPAKRRRRGPSRGQVALEWTVLALVALSPCAAMALFGGVRLWSMGPLAALAGLAGILFFLRPLLFRPVGPLRPPPLAPLLLVVLAYLGVHARAVSEIPQLSTVQFLLVCAGALIYWTCTELGAVESRWKILLGVLLALIGAEGWYAVVQHTRGLAMVYGLPRPEQYGMRASGTWFCPNHFAHMMEIGVLLGCALLGLRGVGMTLRLLAVHAVVLAGYGLVLSQSRSGMLGLVTGLTVLGLLLALHRGLRWFLAGLVAVPAAVGGLAWLGWRNLDRIRERFLQGLNDGGAGRLDMWKGTLDMIRDAPWLGFGGGTFQFVEPAYQRYDSQLSAFYAHNETLHFAAEYGIVGAALILILFVAFAVVLVRRIRRTSSETSAHLHAACLAVLAATFVHAQFDYPLHLYANTTALLLIAGLAAARLGGWEESRVRVRVDPDGRHRPPPGGEGGDGEPQQEASS